MVLCNLQHRGSCQDKPKLRKLYTLEWEQNGQNYRDEVMVCIWKLSMAVVQNIRKSSEAGKGRLQVARNSLKLISGMMASHTKT